VDVTDDVSAADAELMRRIVVDALSDDERERAAERIAESPEFALRLSAVEDELLVQYLQGTLDARWRSGVQAFLDTPHGRARVARMAALRDALLSAPQPSAAPADRAARAGTIAATPRTSSARLFWLAAAAAVGAAAIGGALYFGMRDAAPPAPTIATGPAGPDTIVTLVLPPGLTRSDRQAGNVFRIAPGARTVRLELVVAGEGFARVQAVLRRVGEAPLLESSPDVRREGGDTRIAWSVPSSILSPNDYLLTVTAESSPGVRDTIATRFFSIVE
jgi:hypothetical protein